MSDKLQELLKKKQDILEAFAQAAENQKKSGKKTARERITGLLDGGSFMEICAFLDESAVGEFDIPGDGVVAGAGTVDGRPVYVYAQDFACAGGALSAGNAKKICRVYDMAAKNGAPIVSFLDSAGVRIDEGVKTLSGYGSIIRKAAALSGVVPQITAVAGPCAGTAALVASQADVVLVVDKIGSIYVSGPQIAKAAANGNGEQGSANALAASGAAHKAYATEDECFADIKRLLGYLPSNNLEDAPQFNSTDDMNRLIPELNGMQGSNDVRLIIDSIIDKKEFMELQGEFAKNAITGFARISGTAIGVAANDPGVIGGALDAAACDKFARFVSLCDSFNIPIVTITDTAGFAVAPAQEGGTLAKAAARLASAFAEATVAKISLVCGKAIGGAYVAMNSREIGADLAYAYPWAQISPVDADAATVILFAKDVAASEDPVKARRLAAEEYRDVFASPYEAAKAGLIDDIIEPQATRQILAYALEMQASKRDSGLPKKHGNPLL